MIIKVGSINPEKVEAVKEIIKDYDFLKDAEVLGVKVDSGVPDQPTSWEETFQGAKNRALNAFEDCDISIGIESGMVRLKGPMTEYLNIGVCFIHSDKMHGVGTTPGFEYPPKMVELVLEEGLDITQASVKAGVTDNDNIGAEGGIVSVLSKGKIRRKDDIKQAIRKALIPFQNEGFY